MAPATMPTPTAAPLTAMTSSSGSRRCPVMCPVHPCLPMTVVCRNGVGNRRLLRTVTERAARRQRSSIRTVCTPSRTGTSMTCGCPWTLITLMWPLRSSRAARTNRRMVDQFAQQLEFRAGAGDRGATSPDPPAPPGCRWARALASCRGDGAHCAAGDRAGDRRRRGVGVLHSDVGAALPAGSRWPCWRR